MPSTILIKGHRFTGPSTGLVPSDGTLVVDPDTNELKVGDGSTPGGVALAGGGGGGGVSNIVEDTTPELGGDLVTGDNRITYAGSGTVSFLDFTVTQFGQNNNTVLSSVKSINMFLDSNGGDSGEAFRIYNNTNPDSSPTEDTYIFKVSENGDTNITGKLLLPDGSASANYAGFGANDDLKIFHNGNHSIVREVGTGDLYLQSDNNVILGSDSDTETYVKGIYNGAVELYHNNVLKFNTSSSGVTVVDELHTEGATPHLTLKRTNNANVPTVRFKGSGGVVGASIDFQGTSGTSNELAFQIYDGATIAERFRVTYTGAKVTGDLAVTGNITATSSTIGSIQLIDNNIKSSDSSQLSIQTPTSFTNAGAPGVTIDGDITFEATGAITGPTVDIYGIGNGQVKIGNTGSSINPVKVGNANTAVSIEGALTVSSSIKMAVQAGDPSNVPNYAHVYAKDDASSAEVFVQDEAGNVTKLSPHNQLGNWEYYSKNVKTGKVVRIDMEEMIKDIEQLTGKKYIKGE